jgi:hypothetical protein
VLLGRGELVFGVAGLAVVLGVFDAVLGAEVVVGVVWLAAGRFAGVLRALGRAWIAGALLRGAAVLVAALVEAVPWGVVEVGLLLPPHAAKLSANTTTLAAAAERHPLDVRRSIKHPGRRLESSIPQR